MWVWVCQSALSGGRVDADVFKGLRDRLKGVSQQLEDELEAKLEAELEAELAAEFGESAPAAKEDAPADAQAEASVATDVVEEPEAPAEPAEEVEEAHEPEADAQPSDEPAEPPRQPEPVPSKPEPTQEPEPVARQPEAPAPTPAAPKPKEQAPEPAKPDSRKAKADKPTAPVYGRKVLSEEEIEARLAAELEEAVEIQKEVETVVASEAKSIRRYTINEDVLEDILWELEVALLESDVALPVIEAIKESVKEQLLSMSVGGKDPSEVVEKVLRTAIKRVLAIRPIDFDAFVRDRLDQGKRPVVVMFVGVNGTGKTTSIARLAHRLKGQGLSPVLAAGDTFRAGAIEQLTQHADKLGVKIVKHKAGADPAAVAYDAVEHARARNKDVVLLDTAGRMQTNTNLMDEMDKIRRVADPDLVVFVGDSLAGNDAVEQARRFDQVVDIDGAILTKTDVDAKGGAALSVAYTINKPLLFVGVGQGYDDLKPFDPEWMVARLFGDDGDE